MNRTIRMPHLLSTNRFPIVVVCGLVLATTAAATTPVDLTPGTGQALIDLTGTNNGYNEAGVYTSPYFGTITSSNGSSISTAMICDDYYNDSYLNEEWVANVTNLTSLPLTGSTQTDTSNGPTPLYTGITWNGMTLDQAQEYLVVAVLAEDVMQAYESEATAGSNLTYYEQQAADYGFAIWDLTNTPSTANNNQGAPSVTCPYSDVSSPKTCYSNSDNVLGGLTNTVNAGTLQSPNDENEVVAVLGYINSAVNYVCNDTDCGSPNKTAEQSLLAQYSNVNIYSYAGGGTNCPGGESTCAPPPQEFITVSMDEPSMPLLLGFYGLCAVGLGLAFRGRIANKLG